MSVLFVVLFCLAVHRVTRFVTKDSFPPVARVRAWIERRGDYASWQAYLVTCPWCVSIYVSTGMVLSSIWFVDASFILWPILLLTASGVTGIIEEIMSHYE